MSEYIYLELTTKAFLLYTQNMQKSSEQWRDFPAVILLAVILLSASIKLAATEWTPDLEAVELTVLLGLLLGVVLGASRFNKIGVILLSFGYSLISISWRIVSLINKGLSEISRVDSVSYRLNFAFRQLADGQPVDDYLFFVSLMIIVFWFTGLYAGYVLLRYQSIVAALFPSTLMVLIIQYYDQTRETSLWGIGFYFFFSLLLLGRLNYLEDKKRWAKEKVFVESGVGFDITITTLSAIAIIVLLAWSIPSSRAEWVALTRWWQSSTDSLSDTRKYLDNALASIDEKPVDDSGDLYESRLFLGERPYKNSQVLFTARVLNEELAQRYYWKIRVYDTYNDGHWSHTQNIPNKAIPAQTEILTPNIDIGFPQKFLFTNKISAQSVIILVQEPVSVSRDTRAAFVPIPKGGMDINRLLAQPTLTLDETYTIESSLVMPTIAQMRLAGTDYPDWVRERYLQLPEDFPESIRALALELSTGKDTPYDIASAITNYLRAEIIYNDKIPAPPRGMDPIEWFLFIQKEGFCNYAASANVVLLRAAGIPARMVVGFAQGGTDGQGNYLIRQADAHAWVEVYFPEIGWVEFEPTLNQASLIRPLGEVILAEEEEDILRLLKSDNEFLGEGNISIGEDETPLLENAEDEAKAEGQSLLFWGMIILLTVAALFALWHFNREQVSVTRGLRSVIQIYEKNNLIVPLWLTRWMRWTETNPIERAFYGVNRSLRWLGEETPAHFTPQERAALLIEFLPDKEEQILALLAEHQKALFTPEDGDLKIAQNASFDIRWRVLKRKTLWKKL